jgi:hypothetical protein
VLLSRVYGTRPQRELHGWSQIVRYRENTCRHVLFAEKRTSGTPTSPAGVRTSPGLCFHSLPLPPFSGRHIYADRSRPWTRVRCSQGAEPTVQRERPWPGHTACQSLPSHLLGDAEPFTYCPEDYAVWEGRNEERYYNGVSFLKPATRGGNRRTRTP